MYMQIDASQFRDTFKAYNRQDNFSYAGLNALFEYLEELEDGTGQQIEFDCIAICCDYNEDSFDDIINNYGIEIPEDEAPLSYILDYLEENTIIVAVLEDSILFQVF